MKTPKWKKDLSNLVEYIFLKAGYWIVTHKGSKRDTWEVKALSAFIQSTLEEYSREVEKVIKKQYWEHDDKDGKDLNTLTNYQNMAISGVLETFTNLNTQWGIRNKIKSLLKEI